MWANRHSSTTLVGEDRALVSDVHGTTRDSIEETTLIGGLTFRFVDTAGLRHTDDVVEQMGIERTWQKLDEALLVLWVVDRWPTQEETDEMVAHCKGKHVLLVFNKADLHTPPTDPLVADGGDTGAARSLPPHPISAKTGQGLDAPGSHPPGWSIFPRSTRPTSSSPPRASTTC